MYTLQGRLSHQKCPIYVYMYIYIYMYTYIYTYIYIHITGKTTRSKMLGSKSGMVRLLAEARSYWHHRFGLSRIVFGIYIYVGYTYMYI